MSALQQIQELVTKLSPAERTEVLQWAAHEWIPVPGIERTPGVCGGDARIARTRIPVWLLVEAKRLGVSDVELLESYPSLTSADLENAWAYARAHEAEIDRLIFENSEEEIERVIAQDSEQK